MVYQAGGVPVKIFRLHIVTGAKAPWWELAPNSEAGLQGIPLVRVGAAVRVPRTRRRTILPILDCRRPAIKPWNKAGFVF
jgi:hypothetical protein